MVFRAYFDDAGKLSDPQSRALVTGGLIGTEERWKILYDTWGPILSSHHLSYFSGKECEHGKGEFDKNKRDEWKHPAKRWAVRLELASSIVQSGMVPFVSGLIAADYKALTPKEKKDIGRPFSLVAQALLVIVKDWANASHIYESFPYLFEAGSEGYTEFSEVFNQVIKHDLRRNAYRMESCGVVPKECIGAQAADLIASEYSHCMNSIIDRSRHGFERPSIRKLQELKIETKYLDRQNLLEILSEPRSVYRPFRARHKCGEAKREV